MFFVRFLGLLVTVPFSAAIGSGNNDIALVFTIVFFVAAPALYMLPTIEAGLAEKDNIGSIAIVNLLLGWTIVGWVVAAAWALKKPEVVIVQRPTPALDPEPKSYLVARPLKQCPFCGEDVLASAIKCKHCGSDLQV